MKVHLGCAALLLLWAMAAMMLQTITPRLLLYPRAMRKRAMEPTPPRACTRRPAGTWRRVLFSAGATALQRWFASLFAAEKSSSWLNTQ